MAEQYSIDKTRKKRKSEDYAFLREQGIKHIEKLSGKLWTDYNTHDPGVTILELLCYAITDLSYRNSYEITDILTDNNGGPGSDDNSFYSAAGILPCNPVTITDFRKLLVDLKGVKNVWFQTKDVKDYKTFYVDYENSLLSYTTGDKSNPVKLSGLYNVLVEYEEAVDKKTLKASIKDKLHGHRNLCEDFVNIDEVLYEDIAICAEIEVSRESDINEVLAEVYYQLGEYFSPQINFYTIEEMLKMGKGIEEIFEGPLLEHGFICDEELEEADLRTELRVSDIINFIMDIKGVVAVKSILLTSYVNGIAKEVNKDWILKLSSDGLAPRLSMDKTKVIFYKDKLPYIASKTKVEKKLRELNESRKRYKLDGHSTDLDIPEGNNRDISDYYPVQHEFPLCYGIGEAGLPDSATDLRKAQAKQLKAYLLFFEQILANYFSQLANVKQLFSFDESVDKTYFTNQLSEITGIDGLYLDYNDYKNSLQGLAEDEDLFLKRRNRFLDHLMARFSEEIIEYSLLLHSLMGKDAYAELIKDKIDFLKDYQVISAQRGKAFNYKDKTLWDSDNVAGMKKRVSRLLGFGEYKRRDYGNDKIKIVKISADKYVIKLVDPDDASKTLLSSIEYPNEECAEGILQYILAHGDNKDKYASTTSGGKYYFNLLNECNDVIATSNAYGTKKKRDEELAGTIEFFKKYCDIEGFHLVEHILLRPKLNYKLLPINVSKGGQPGGPNEGCPHVSDPYSFRISVILPSWPEKFHDVNFRRFVEKTIRQETPAHIFPRICWIDLKQMKDFEKHYNAWLKEIAEKDKPSQTKVDNLSDVIFNLKNVYPAAKLHDCQDTDSDDPQVTLDYSTIGVI